MGAEFSWLDRTVSSVAGLLLFAALLVGTALEAQPADAPVGVGPLSPRSVARVADRPAMTTLTFRVSRCEGCRLGLIHWVGSRPPFISAARAVRHGKARFTVRTALTQGMEVTVTAPWQGATMYGTFAVFRYATRHPGQHIRFAAARRQSLGSACWAGTSTSKRTIKLAVRPVEVRALDGRRVTGVLAWAPRQQATWKPMRAVAHGVYGSEEATLCSRPAA